MKFFSLYKALSVVAGLIAAIPQVRDLFNLYESPAFVPRPAPPRRKVKGGGDAPRKLN